MKIETQPLDDNQVKLIAEIDSEQFEKSKRQAARKISRETKIPGFRPGKAPYDVIRRIVGEDAIVKEAIGLLVDDVYPQALEQAEISPYGPGTLDEIVSMEPVTFSFVVPLVPEVDLGDYRSIRETYQPNSTDEKEVEQFIERMRYNYATIHPAERPAEEGDLVFITVSGRLTSPEEGEEPVVVDDRPLQVTIRPVDEQTETEWPFQGFAQELIGLSADEQKTITHSFPEDSDQETFKGKEVEFTVKVQSVKKLEVPALDDEFSQSVGDFENIDALREAVRTSLEASSQEEYDREYFSTLIDRIKEQASIKYPPQAVEDEIQEVLRSLERDLARQKLDLETYLKIRNQERETFIEAEVKPAALKRLERSLIIDEIARVEQIKLKDQEFEQTYTQTLAELQRTEDFDEMRKKVPADRLANAVAMEAATRLMNSYVFNRLKAIANEETELETDETAPVETVDKDSADENVQDTEPVITDPEEETSAAAPPELSPEE